MDLLTNPFVQINVYGCDDTKEEADIDQDRVWLVYLRSAMNTIFDSPREKFNSSPALYHLWGTDLPTKEFSMIQAK